MTALLAVLLLGPPSDVTASWYAAGSVTASGSTFDQHAMTAASPDLPFGAVLLLERNGRQVAVEITDRGPYATDSTGAAIWPLQPHPTRELDLSAGAMKALGGISAGVVTARAWRMR